MRLLRLGPGSFLVFGLLFLGGTPVFAQDASPADLETALAKVDELRDNGAFEEARTRLQTLRDTHGDRVGVLWRASLTLVDIGKTNPGTDKEKGLYEDALRLADQALSVDSTSAHAHLAKAVAEGRLALDAKTKERVQRSRAIEEHANQAIELDSTLASAYHVRGRWHREASDLNFFERTIVKTVYGGLPESSFEQAVQNFKRAIELEDQRFHHLELAKTYLKMDRDSEAKAELETVLSLPPEDPFAGRYKKEAEKLLAELK